MSQSTLSDTDIFRITTYSDPDDKGRVQLRCKLPSGRTITSTDRLIPTEVKGKVLIAWANHIREQDALDAQEREEQDRLKAAAKRDSSQRGAARGEADASAGNSQSAPAGLPDDPGSMIKEKLTGLMERATTLDQIISEHSTQLKEVHENIAKWTKVAEGLGIDLAAPDASAKTAEPKASDDEKEEESSDDSKTDEKPESDDSGDGSDAKPDGGAGSRKSTGRRSKRGPRAKRSAKRNSDRDAAGSSQTVKSKEGENDSTSE